MSLKDNAVGLILGSGFLTKTLIDNLRRNNIRFYIIGTKDNYDTSFGNPDYNLDYNKIGNVFNYLKKKKINHVILLGKIEKKKILSFRPDLITFYYLLKIFFFYNRGDGQLLNRILKIFYENNINVLDPRSFLKNNLCTKKSNVIINKSESNLPIKKIKKYFNIAKTFGLRDLGQAVIISGDKIILSEDRHGTDNLINRFKQIKYNKPAYLVKVSKPKQDLRVDLPTIGPKTIEHMIEANLSGIILEANKTFVENPKQTFKLINKYRLFFYAI